MSLDKAIKSGKEHRREYRIPQSVDVSCRNHGGCDWCERNRMYNYNKRIAEFENKIAEFEQTENENNQQLKLNIKGEKQ